jgi:hypothetical protein
MKTLPVILFSIAAFAQQTLVSPVTITSAPGGSPTFQLTFPAATAQFPCIPAAKIPGATQGEWSICGQVVNGVNEITVDFGTGVFAPLVGPKGDTGSSGATGASGVAATVTVGKVSTGAPGSAATVTNSGTLQAAVLNFSIPQGATGASETGSSAVTSVFGRTGAVTAKTGDYAFQSIGGALAASQLPATITCSATITTPLTTLTISSGSSVQGATVVLSACK